VRFEFREGLRLVHLKAEGIVMVGRSRTPTRPMIRTMPLTTAQDPDIDPAYSPNGKMIVYSDGNGDTVVMNANGKNKELVR
jgi:Tol biopolymer transport system component